MTRSLNPAPAHARADGARPVDEIREVAQLRGPVPVAFVGFDPGGAFAQGFSIRTEDVRDWGGVWVPSAMVAFSHLGSVRLRAEPRQCDRPPD